MLLDGWTLWSGSEWKVDVEARSKKAMEVAVWAVDCRRVGKVAVEVEVEGAEKLWIERYVDWTAEGVEEIRGESLCAEDDHCSKRTCPHVHWRWKRQALQTHHLQGLWKQKSSGGSNAIRIPHHLGLHHRRLPPPLHLRLPLTGRKNAFGLV